MSEIDNMSGDLPDFDDLLAAYDIPDVTVRIREATTEDGPASPEGGGEGGGEGGEMTIDEEKNASNGIDNVSTDTNGSMISGAGDQKAQTKGNEETVQESTKSDQSSEGSKESSTVQETTLNKTSEIVVSKVDKSVTITIPNDGTKAETSLIRKILSPTNSTSGFKNTSSDGPKILNVSGGTGNLGVIAVTKQVDGTNKPSQVVLRHFGPNKVFRIPTSSTAPPVIFPGSKSNISPSTKSGIYSSAAGGALCRISTAPSGQQNVVVTVMPNDSYDEEIKKLSRKQLEKSNPIDTYHMTPPPDDLGIDIPMGGYKCLICSDTYALESSLTQHMERRSVKILMNCTFCRRKLEFYNKCSMHTHLRSHNMTNINPTLDATVSPLDVLSTGGHQGAGRPKGETKKQPSEQEVEQPKETGKSVKSLLQQARQRFEDRLHTKTVTTSGTHIPLGSLPDHCPACSIKVGSTRAALSAHFQICTRDKQHGCNICSMVLANTCQLQVHKNIHTGASPWLCPECAMLFCNYSAFQKHLNQDCLHFRRTASFTCKLCPQAKFQNSLSAYRVHLSTFHKNSFYKCVNCQLAFRSVDALKMHGSTQHNYNGRPLCSIISKCPLCDTVFTKNSLLVSHLATHINTFVPAAFSFVCPECPFGAASIKGLQGHNIQLHYNRSWWYCDICRHHFPSRESVRKHRATKHPEYPSLREAEEGKTTGLPNGSHHDADKSVKKQKSSNDKIATNSSSSDKQQSTKVIIKRMYRCPGCKELGVDIFFKKENNLRKHLVRSHPNINADAIQGDCMEYVPLYPSSGQVKVSDQPDTATTTDSQVTGHKRKRSREAHDSASRIKRLKEDKLSCAKCDFESKDRGVFISHIDEHKSDKHSSQCKECGICFRVKDSLHKHLFVRHQIRNMKAYGEFLKEALESVAKSQVEQEKEVHIRSAEREKSKSPANPLECKICHKVFESDAVMMLHMRSHGMAYIRTKAQSIVGDQV